MALLDNLATAHDMLLQYSIAGKSTRIWQEETLANLLQLDFGEEKFGKFVSRFVLDK